MSLKIIFEVPDTFKTDYFVDKFNDCFNRVITDLNVSGICSGNYEKEILEMLSINLANSESIENELSLTDTIKTISKSTKKHLIKDSYCGFVSYECPTCHHEVKDSYKYCCNCGQKVR